VKWSESTEVEEDDGDEIVPLLSGRVFLMSIEIETHRCEYLRGEPIEIYELCKRDPTRIYTEIEVLSGE
jgi:tricorn protease-like protein